MVVKSSLETLRVLPDASGNRFGMVQLGADRINQIRAEHAALVEVAGELCHDLSVIGLAAVRLQIHTRAALPRDEQLSQTYAAIEQLVQIGKAADVPPADVQQLAADAALWLLALGHRDRA